MASFESIQAAMDDLQVIDEQDLPDADSLNTYFLDLAALIRSLLNDNKTIRQLTWKTLHSIPKQYSTIYVACDTYREQSIKAGERRLRGEGKRCHKEPRYEASL